MYKNCIIWSSLCMGFPFLQCHYIIDNRSQLHVAMLEQKKTNIHSYTCIIFFAVHHSIRLLISIVSLALQGWRCMYAFNPFMISREDCMLNKVKPSNEEVSGRSKCFYLCQGNSTLADSCNKLTEVAEAMSILTKTLNRLSLGWQVANYSLSTWK